MTRNFGVETCANSFGDYAFARVSKRRTAASFCLAGTQRNGGLQLDLTQPEYGSCKCENLFFFFSLRACLSSFTCRFTLLCVDSFCTQFRCSSSGANATLMPELPQSFCSPTDKEEKLGRKVLFFCVCCVLLGDSATRYRA